ncbi:MAG TPA: hypothetical protein ENK55_04120 [Actinobacteria bacterium]|nr:hypothetical protein [Actinomycetota bacterium]
MDATIVFLGTGAAGGTPGPPERTESSAAIVAPGTIILVDVTTHFDRQVSRLPGPPDAVVLTHAHRDASGGIPRLRRHWLAWRRPPIPTFASAAAIDVVRRRHRRLDHLDLRPVDDDETVTIGPWLARPRTVPHARDPRFPTYAWRLDGPSGVVYASDISRLTDRLEELVEGAELLVLDGASWGHRIPNHLRIDADLPVACSWRVGRILLTQLGRNVPGDLETAVTRLCPRARPARDGLVVVLDGGRRQ